MHSCVPACISAIIAGHVLCTVATSFIKKQKNNSVMCKPPYRLSRPDNLQTVPSVPSQRKIEGTTWPSPINFLDSIAVQPCR